MTTVLEKLSRAQLLELEKELNALDDRHRFRKMDFFEPYPKQQTFFDMGLTLKERLLMAGNQQGKTEAGAYEVACHMTGDYPDWWLGRRWDRPTKGWIAGETSLLTRDVQQKKLCGEPGVDFAFGTGYLPKAAFVDKPSLARGITDAYDTIQVRHKSGGVSVARFKSYEQGRAKFQGDSMDWIWCDEEPPMDIYSECIARLTATHGMIYVTFTPLKGMSDVVLRFLNEKSDQRGVVTMVIEDAKHIPPEERQKIIDSYPAHEREARARGVPMLGSGRIFQIAEEAITEPPLEYIPPYWVKIWGIDFGIGHPFAAALLIWDKDNDVIHLHHCLKMPDALPLMHAAAMKPIGANVKVAWPQDGTAREKGSGEVVASHYKKAGLLMLPDHATWPDGSVSTEAGILEMQERMKTARFKVAAQLGEFFEEYRLYHRKDGMIVKIRDDIISAIQKALMMKRYATAVALGGNKPRQRPQEMADGIDFDLFTGA